MHTRRLLFVRGRSGLAPFLAALATLVALALLGLVIALWPPVQKTSAHRPTTGETASGDRPAEGSLRVAPKAREGPGRTRGI
jgi:hypothetical protein